MTISSSEVEVYLSLGSNLGDRLGFLRRGIDSISKFPDVKARRISDVYETEPVGYVHQPEFLNLAACFSTFEQPKEFLKLLKEIEIKIGRVHRERWHEREIDIDVIFFGDRIINSKDLIIPHPRMHLRKFVLQPLNEIAPNFVHPLKQKEVNQLLTECPDTSRVRRVKEFRAPLS
ncbi:MAG: 2-amino-4-hydroxy-6-hydroxymethyldihydropteridine diphosphokinase [Candidatus Kryptoniota bacterium]